MPATTFCSLQVLSEIANLIIQKGINRRVIKVFQIKANSTDALAAL